MSRRLPPAHCRHPSASDNPYQPTTVPIHQRAPSYHQYHGPRPPKGAVHCHNGFHAVDSALSDDTDFHAYYDHCQGHRRYHNHYEGRYSCSDDSGSTRLRYENDDEPDRRLSRTAYASERSQGRRARAGPPAHKDVRRVYPQQYVQVEGGVYQEIASQVGCDNVTTQNPQPRRIPNSRLSDRPQSSMSSGVTSAIVDGCGGKCQTFENVCYFFLQLVFMMGILIGASLCIAGFVLRNSAARNLQVLTYIGVLLAVVSSVLLGIQWNARNAAKRRKMALRNAKRAPIPLETLHPRGQQLQRPLMAVQDGQRVVPQIIRPLPPQPDQQGIPWWRRKDLT